MKQYAMAAVMNPEGEVLLQLRSDVPIWVLPGGGIERGESPETAAKREVLEETGLEVDISKRIGKYFVKHPLYRGDLTHVFLCKSKGGKLAINHESLKIGFFEKNKLPRPILRIHRQRILDAFAKRENVVARQKAAITEVLWDVGFRPSILLRLAAFLILLQLQKIFK